MIDAKTYHKKHEEFMKKLDDLNDRTYKSVKRLVKAVMKDIDFSEKVIFVGL